MKRSHKLGFGGFETLGDLETDCALGCATASVDSAVGFLALPNGAKISGLSTGALVSCDFGVVIGVFSATVLSEAGRSFRSSSSFVAIAVVSRAFLFVTIGSLLVFIPDLSNFSIRSFSLLTSLLSVYIFDFMVSL